MKQPSTLPAYQQHSVSTTQSDTVLENAKLTLTAEYLVFRCSGANAFLMDELLNAFQAVLGENYDNHIFQNDVTNFPQTNYYCLVKSITDANRDQINLGLKHFLTDNRTDVLANKAEILRQIEPNQTVTLNIR